MPQKGRNSPLGNDCKEGSLTQLNRCLLILINLFKKFFLVPFFESKILKKVLDDREGEALNTTRRTVSQTIQTNSKTFVSIQF